MKRIFLVFVVVAVSNLFVACDKDEPQSPPTGLDKVLGTWNGIYNNTDLGSLVITKISANRIKLVPNLANHSTTELDVTDTTFTSGSETITEVEGSFGTATTDQIFYARISNKAGATTLQYSYLNPVAAENWLFSSTK